MPTSRANKPTVVITIGNPSGIGPEVSLKALARPEISRLANFFVIGDGFVIDRLEKDLNLKLKVPLLDLANVSPKNFSYGKLVKSLGAASIEYIDTALTLLEEGHADALVTAPVNKYSINEAGISNFQGHTEYLARKTATKDYAMMFVGKNLKVTLVTRHIALKYVPSSLSVESVYKTIMLTHKYLRRFFAVQNPRIGVSGLNPHAGEGGIFGREEENIITPAIRKASKEITYLSGPVPPDIIFYEALNKRYDAVISMYHDQGLIPFKMLYFKNGVNLTLGLPFIRTSPDHGTANMIAGKGIADPSSMIEAIRLACQLSLKAKFTKR